MKTVKNEHLFRRFIMHMTKVQIETAGCIYEFVDDLEFMFISLEEHYGDSFDAVKMFSFVENYKYNLEREFKGK